MSIVREIEKIRLEIELVENGVRKYGKQHQGIVSKHLNQVNELIRFCLVEVTPDVIRFARVLEVDGYQVLITKEVDEEGASIVKQTGSCNGRVVNVSMAFRTEYVRDQYFRLYSESDARGFCAAMRQMTGMERDLMPESKEG